MKRIIIIILIILASETYANPAFTISSNYYLTIFAFPHDILKWPNSGLFFYYNPQTLPWQGDVTDISNRPDEAYTTSYQEIEFAPPSGYEGNPNDIHSWMRISGYAYKTYAAFGGIYQTKLGKFLLELGKTSLNMELLAEGVGRAEEEVSGGSEYHLVPFQAETNAYKEDYDIKVIYANKIFDNPFGLKLKYIKKSSDVPHGYTSFTKEGQKLELTRLTWGWTTASCNHIFGYSHINADAYFQDRYSVFNGHQIDFQLSYEHKGNYKTGLRYRRSREDGDNYRWQYFEGSDVQGQYYVDENWKDRKTNDFIRAYSKIRFWQFDNLDAGFLFLFQYGSHLETPVNKISPTEPLSEEREREFIIETNPFLNFRFKGGYLDFGLLLEISKTSMKNTRTRWNSVSHGNQKGVLWNTSPYSGWTPSWENFSKGSQWFFATGFESYSSIAIYKRLSLLAQITYFRKFTFTEKVYGESVIPEGGNSYTFHQSHERNDYNNEHWLTGSLGFSYGWGPMQFFATLQLPLAYLVKQETKLHKNEKLLFEHKKRDTWQVQEPATMRLLFVYAFGK